VISLDSLIIISEIYLGSFLHATDFIWNRNNLANDIVVALHWEDVKTVVMPKEKEILRGYYGEKIIDDVAIVVREEILVLIVEDIEN